jgi:hypothetical protein
MGYPEAMTTPAKPKIDPRVFERAAEMTSLKDPPRSMHEAIEAACPDNDDEHEYWFFFARLFCPDISTTRGFQTWWQFLNIEHRGMLLARQIALDLAALIAREEQGK